LQGSPSNVFGIVLVIGAYFLFAMQDAVIKLLVADLAVPQILFVRSLVILLICTVLDRSTPLCALRSPLRLALSLRGVVLFGAWLLYYSSARWLQLAEMMTIYFASPLMVVVLAVPLLGEKVPPVRWAAIAIGFLGVLFACRPTDLDQPLPILMALTAAALWAYAIILIRGLVRAETTFVQMFLTSAMFLLACGMALPWLWVTPDGLQLAGLLLVGLLAGAAQYLLYEGIKHAPASVAAPLEFTALIWAFGLGYLVWGDVPVPAVFVGAGLIMASGLMIILAELRQARLDRPRSVAEPRI
jgi:drug/metabolite transporter (DMT)-like permease